LANGKPLAWHLGKTRIIIEAAALKETLQPENKTGYVVQTDPLPANV
jgi:hypothetical protein